MRNTKNDQLGSQVEELTTFLAVLFSPKSAPATLIQTYWSVQGRNEQGVKTPPTGPSPADDPSPKIRTSSRRVAELLRVLWWIDTGVARKVPRGLTASQPRNNTASNTR